MKENIEIIIQQSMAQNKTYFSAGIDNQTLAQLMPEMVMQKVIEEVAHAISERVLRENGQKIFKAISQEAVATLAVAEAGRGIKEMLDKKLPDKIVEVTKREVYQRGIFGGLKRI